MPLPERLKKRFQIKDDMARLYRLIYKTFNANGDVKIATLPIENSLALNGEKYYRFQPLIRGWILSSQKES